MQHFPSILNAGQDRIRSVRAIPTNNSATGVARAPGACYLTTLSGDAGVRYAVPCFCARHACSSPLLTQHIAHAYLLRFQSVQAFQRTIRRTLARRLLPALQHAMPAWQHTTLSRSSVLHGNITPPFSSARIRGDNGVAMPVFAFVATCWWRTAKQNTFLYLRWLDGFGRMLSLLFRSFSFTARLLSSSHVYIFCIAFYML